MTPWPALPFEEWRDTCDTIHAHAQVLGKLAGTLSPPEPHYEHLALRLTARGWETRPLSAPDGSGALVASLDLHRHCTVVEHSDGRSEEIALAPNRSVGTVTRGVLAAFWALGGHVEIPLRPSETGWTTALDEDEEHATYDEAHVAEYLAAATRAALVLAELRASYRGHATPVNAWWGSFDLAVSLFGTAPAGDEPPEVAVGWWPGDSRYPRAAFYAYARPSPSGAETLTLAPRAARWDATLGEFLLDWDDVRAAADPHAAALDFGRTALGLLGEASGWDPSLTGTPKETPAG
jgi:hypothetical protein